MALNTSIFKTRSLTAAVFVVIMLTGILWSPWSFLALFTFIHFGCWVEYQRLMGLIDKDYADISSIHRYGIMIAGCCLIVWIFSLDEEVAGLWARRLDEWVFIGLILLSLIAELIRRPAVALKNIGRSLLGLLYISLPISMLVFLRMCDIAPVVMIIGSIWINDTMAYIAGSLVGRTPLSSISPKKTLEGTLGGIVLSIGVMGLVGWLWGPVPDCPLSAPVHWIVVAAIASVTGTFGDLLESKLKRMAGVKDSGHIMPGHGGFLDRFDSLLIATPCAFAYLAGFAIIFLIFDVQPFV
jgi:phosphatidate cytidylyltransferase